MYALAEFLFPAPARRGVAPVMKWWEARRLHYNVIVGATGLFSYGMSTILGLIGPHSHGPIPVLACVAFGVMANICYTFGAATEIAIDKMWGSSALPVGPALFRMGLTFSVGLAMLPSLISIFELGMRILTNFF